VAPHFVSYYPAEGSISYPENSTLNFSCQAFAIPAVNVSWIFKNKVKQSKSETIESVSFSLAEEQGELFQIFTTARIST
jgi:hypothetical protein